MLSVRCSCRERAELCPIRSDRYLVTTFSPLEMAIPSMFVVHAGVQLSLSLLLHAWLNYKSDVFGGGMWNACYLLSDKFA